MSLSNNPHTVYNGMLSSQRNMFLSSSLAIGLIGFSEKFKRSNIRLTMSLFASSIVLLSLWIGFKSIADFEFYLNNTEMPKHIPIESWSTWKYVVYMYSFVLISIVMLFVINRLLIDKVYKQ